MITCQDVSFVRQLTQKKRIGLHFADVEIWGGLAQVDVEVAYHFDNGALTVDDVELAGFEISGFCGGRDSAWFRWESRQVEFWKQRRINQVLGSVWDRIS